MIAHCNGAHTDGEGCGHTWHFVSRKLSENLKRSYWVRCPSCQRKVFRRIKRKRMEVVV